MLKQWVPAPIKRALVPLRAFLGQRNLEAGQGVRIFQGSQTDEAFLRSVVEALGGIDIIIDDGSHVNEHILTTFDILFPLLNDGGIYAIEDLQTSYWPSFGGGQEPGLPTAMNHLKHLADGLNHEEYHAPGYQASYYDRHITALHFYHNLAFIYQGRNQEGSNLVVNNRLPPDVGP